MTYDVPGGRMLCSPSQAVWEEVFRKVVDFSYLSAIS